MQCGPAHLLLASPRTHAPPSPTHTHAHPSPHPRHSHTKLMLPSPTSRTAQSGAVEGGPTRAASAGRAATYALTPSASKASKTAPEAAPPPPAAAAAAVAGGAHRPSPCSHSRTPKTPQRAVAPANGLMPFSPPPLPPELAAAAAGAAAAGAAAGAASAALGTSPRSVMIPWIRSPGVTSKEGFHTGRSAATRSPRKCVI